MTPREQRPHRPHELGPVLFKRGAWYAADLRPWGGGRVTLRDPSAPGWPQRGDRTELRAVAETWRMAYMRTLIEPRQRRQLGLGPKARRLADAVKDFLAHRELAVSYLTWRNDRAALLVHWLPAIGKDEPTDAIEAAALQAVVDRLRRDGYALSTLERYVHTAGALFDWLGRKDNPAQGVVLPERQDPDARAWDDDELRAIRRAADRLDRGGHGKALLPGAWHPSVPVRRAIELGVGTGGRQAELLALDWRAFRERDHTVRFTRQVAHQGAGHAGYVELKGKRARTTLVLPSWWRHHRRGETGLVLGTVRLDEPGLHTAYRWIKLVYEMADVDEPRVGWHTLRHTYARLFLEMGGSLLELQKSLGHGSIETTQWTYEHFDEDTAAALAARRIYAKRSGSGSGTGGR